MSLASLLAVAGLAAATPCALPQTPEVTVAINAPEPAIDHSLSRAALAEVAGVAADHPTGATRAGGQIDFVPGEPVIVSADGGRSGCVFVARIAVTMLIDQRIYVAADYPPGSCPYRITLAHEMRHVAVNRAVAQRLSPTVRAAFLAVAQRGEPFHGGDVPGAVAAVQGRMRAALTQMIARLQTERDRAHRSVDTPIEYARVARACLDW